MQFLHGLALSSTRGLGTAYRPVGLPTSRQDSKSGLNAELANSGVGPQDEITDKPLFVEEAMIRKDLGVK